MTLFPTVEDIDARSGWPHPNPRPTAPTVLDVIVLVAMASLSVGFGWGVDEGGTYATWRRPGWALMSAEWLQRWGPRG